jgi:arginase
MGPDTIRNAGLLGELSQLGWTVEDKGNLPFDTVDPDQDEPCNGTKNPRQVGGATKKIFTVGKQEIEKKHAVLNLGGDHSLAIGTIAASASVYSDLRVLWIDAHGKLIMLRISTYI